ncbi:MAG TPA: IPTL-CTERM sorting domain-containing protein [Thermoanaerobaculia bacterium]|nr:IPTL-CTERM sorting domain-containing protein [Thermoanaerobaculia bacterium]
MAPRRILSPFLPGVLEFFLAATAFAGPRYVAPAGSDAANSCASPASPCATFQHAVDVALSGDSIEIAPAVYDQRVRIEGKAGLTVNATGVTLRPDLAVLGLADAAQGSPCSGTPGRAVVFVRNSTGIVLNGLLIDGSLVFAAPNEPARLVGIFYRNASGAISGGGVIHLRTEPASSNQVAGLGILVQTDEPAESPPPRVDINGVTIADFQKSAIVFSGCDCAADGGPTGSVRLSTISSETNSLVGRNGVQVSFGASGVVIEGNTISDLRLTGDPSLGLGSAVILASSRNDHVVGNVLRDANFGISNIGDIFCPNRAGENLDNEIRCNQILDHDIGLTLDNDSHTIHDNAFSGNTQWGILARDYYPAGQPDADATFNWWGSPTGPTTPSNPGGTGDAVSPRVAYAPFLVLPPTCAAIPVSVPTLSAAGLAVLALLLGLGAVQRLQRRQWPGRLRLGARPSGE